MLTKTMKAMSREQLQNTILDCFGRLVNSVTDAETRFREGNYEEVVIALKSAPSYDDLFRALYVWQAKL